MIALVLFLINLLIKMLLDLKIEISVGKIRRV